MGGHRGALCRRLRSLPVMAVLGTVLRAARPQVCSSSAMVWMAGGVARAPDGMPAIRRSAAASEEGRVFSIARATMMRPAITRRAICWSLMVFAFGLLSACGRGVAQSSSTAGTSAASAMHIAVTSGIIGDGSATIEFIVEATQPEPSDFVPGDSLIQFLTLTTAETRVRSVDRGRVARQTLTSTSGQGQLTMEELRCAPDESCPGDQIHLLTESVRPGKYVYESRFSWWEDDGEPGLDEPDGEGMFRIEYLVEAR